jgi:CubicO group peptidase (beta-lactamase class C family)
MVLMQAYAEGLVRLDDRCSRWIRNDGSYEVEVIRN